ncbi:MAG: hypothetical protein Q9216_006390 [Gyalolechia sp. 2 TL-2023]
MPSRRAVWICVGSIAILATALGVGLAMTLPNRHPSHNAAPSDNPSSGGTSFTGALTYYAPGLGACGMFSTAADAICAISHVRFDAAASSGANPNLNPLCGKQIRATRGGKSVLVTVVDRCEGCEADDIDFSPSAFGKLADEREGRVEVNWEWAG